MKLAMRVAVLSALTCAVVAWRHDAEEALEDAKSLAELAPHEAEQDEESSAHHSKNIDDLDITGQTHTCCCKYADYTKKVCGGKAKSPMYKYIYKSLSECKFDPWLCESHPGWTAIIMGKSATEADCDKRNGGSTSSMCAHR
ncbi:unnamed protein product [Symbiodinium pilosum]|uniref:CPW-WPC domain-containing protein n=1 Tax=Symbiodinium pilosum TaxID=2952 RepID=A0A812PTA1_SYMPI|nr:unnamed protein product [Symbiodinium pilosum]